MYARVTHFQMDPQRRDDAARIADESIMPGMRDDQGFEHIYVLMDASTGDGIVVTLWNAQADMDASQSKVGQRFGQLGDIVTGQPQPSRTYEVVSHG